MSGAGRVRGGGSDRRESEDASWRSSGMARSAGGKEGPAEGGCRVWVVEVSTEMCDIRRVAGHRRVINGSEVCTRVNRVSSSPGANSLSMWLLSQDTCVKELSSRGAPP